MAEKVLERHGEDTENHVKARHMFGGPILLYIYIVLITRCVALRPSCCTAQYACSVHKYTSCENRNGEQFFGNNTKTPLYCNLRYDLQASRLQLLPRTVVHPVIQLISLHKLSSGRSPARSTPNGKSPENKMAYCFHKRIAGTQ